MFIDIIKTEILNKENMAQVSQVVKILGIPVYRNLYFSSAIPSLQLFTTDPEILEIPDKKLGNYTNTDIGFKNDNTE